MDHRDNIYGDYDEFDDIEALIGVIRTQKDNIANLKIRDK